MDGGATRASDGDRRRIVEALEAQTAEGRLTLAEFEERAGAAYAARTWTDLRRLVEDLPVEITFDGERPPAPPRPTRSAPDPVPAPRRVGALDRVAPLLPLLVLLAVVAVVAVRVPFAAVFVLLAFARRGSRFGRYARMRGCSRARYARRYR